MQSAKRRSCGTLDIMLAEEAISTGASGRDPMDPFCWKAGAEGDWTSPNHSSMQIVQICPASTSSGAGPLLTAEARSARALDEPVSQ